MELVEQFLKEYDFGPEEVTEEMENCMPDLISAIEIEERLWILSDKIYEKYGKLKKHSQNVKGLLHTT